MSSNLIWINNSRFHVIINQFFTYPLRKVNCNLSSIRVMRYVLGSYMHHGKWEWWVFLSNFLSFFIFSQSRSICFHHRVISFLFMFYMKSGTNSIKIHYWKDARWVSIEPEFIEEQFFRSVKCTSIDKKNEKKCLCSWCWWPIKCIFVKTIHSK